MRSGSTGRRTRAHALMSGLCRRKRRCATRRYLDPREPEDASQCLLLEFKGELVEVKLGLKGELDRRRRQGVRWHNKPPMNGRLLTAQDVEFTFHRMLGLGDFAEAGPTPFGGAGLLKGIPFESITATDDATVVLKLKEPYPPAFHIITLNYFTY